MRISRYEDPDDLTNEIIDSWNQNPRATYRGGTRREWFDLIAKEKPDIPLHHITSIEDMEEISILAERNGFQYIEEVSREQAIDMQLEVAEALAEAMIENPDLAKRFLQD